MTDNPLVPPFLGMLLLTLVVWVYMYIRRITFMMKNNIPAHAGATPQKFYNLMPDGVNAPAYNFNNLLQMPVLFYAICLYLMWSGQVDDWHVRCAYLFLGARIVHSLIHCTINHVMSRFIVYVISSIAVWVMIVRAALALAGGE